MKKLLLALGAALLLSSGAQASITPLLATVTPDGSDFVFNYTVSLSGDEGLTNGSKLVIFDFAGYVPGSIISPSANIVASTELTSNFDVTTGGVQASPMFADDPTLMNLVFTYTGPDLQTSGGPFAALVLNGFTAESTLGGVALDGFSSRAISNDGMGTVGTASFNNGAIGVAAVLDAVPEPAGWSMLIVGFGGVGALLRSKRRGHASACA
jgi:hypothetical protein